MNLNEIGLTETDDANVLQSRMRHQRNQLLAASDWAMLADAPTDKTKWGAYRQALRDFPKTWTVSEICTFPESPASTG